MRAVFRGNLTRGSSPISRQHAQFMLTMLLKNAGGEFMHYADACLFIHYLRRFSYRSPCEERNVPVTAHLAFWHDLGLCNLHIFRAFINGILHNERECKMYQNRLQIYVREIDGSNFRVTSYFEFCFSFCVSGRMWCSQLEISHDRFIFLLHHSWSLTHLLQ
jgi:hypothetical protein